MRAGPDTLWEQTAAELEQQYAMLVEMKAPQMERAMRAGGDSGGIPPSQGSRGLPHVEGCRRPPYAGSGDADDAMSPPPAPSMDHKDHE